MTVNLDQQAFRIRTDNTAAEGGTPVWAAAQNTNISISAGTPFRIRFAVANTGTTDTTSAQFRFYYSLNGGAYAQLTNYTAPGVSPAYTSDVTAGASADNSAINTSLLTGATGIFTSGQYDFTNATGAFILPHGDYTETEVGIIIQSRYVKNGDTISFQVFSNQFPVQVYTQTPTLTIVQAPTQDQVTQVALEEFVTFKDSSAEQAQVTYMVVEHWMSAATEIPEQAIVTKMVLEHWQSVTPYIGPPVNRAMFLP